MRGTQRRWSPVMVCGFQKRTHGLELLNNVQEAILVGFLLARCRHGERMSKKSARSLASILFPTLSFSLKWSKRFMARNAEILNEWRKTCSLAEKRVSVTTYNQARLFCGNLKDLLEDFHQLGHHVLLELFCSADDTLLHASSDGKVTTEIIPSWSKAGSSRPSDEKTIIGSVVVFSAADGLTPYAYFCIKKSVS